jgi:hypothetical protein
VEFSAQARASNFPFHLTDLGLLLFANSYVTHFLTTMFSLSRGQLFRFSRVRRGRIERSTPVFALPLSPPK